MPSRRRVLTLPVRRFRAELCALRAEHGLKLSEVAERAHGDFSVPTLSRWEEGATLPRPGDLRSLLHAYGVPDGKRDDLLALLREASRPTWWAKYRRVLKTGFDDYLGLESDSAHIQTYEALLVPGLMQTEAYAREIIRASLMNPSKEQVARNIEVRMARQELIIRDQDPIRLDVVLDEAVVRRPGRTARTRREQLRHLATLAELSNVSVRVLPFDTGPHASMEGAFAILEFADPDDPAAVYFEHAASGFALDDQAEVRQYARRFGHLTQQALDPEASAALILEAADR